MLSRVSSLGERAPRSIAPIVATGHVRGPGQFDLGHPASETVLGDPLANVACTSGHNGTVSAAEQRGDRTAQIRE